MPVGRLKTEGRRTHAERRREAETRIMQAALDIIGQRGLDQLTLAEAGAVAGYSRALPAHYFGSREELVAAATEHLVQVYMNRLMLAGESNPAKAFDLETLLKVISFYFDINRENPPRLRAYYEMIDAAPRLPAILPVITRLHRAGLDGFSRHIRLAQQGGFIRADIDPDAEAVVIMGALRGMMGQWLLDPERVDVEASRAALLAGFRRAWTPG